MTPVSSRDREMILNPLRWPRLNLPIVRDGHNGERPDAAVVIAPLHIDKYDSSSPITIVIGNMFLISKDSPRQTYKNVDALLEDGWRVD